VPGKCLLITVEDIDQTKCRALGGEEGSVRERGLLGLYSKRLLDHQDCICCMESSNITNFGLKFWEIYIRSSQYKMEFGCQINILFL